MTEDPPLLAPVHRELNWAKIHSLSQSPHGGSGDLLARIRRTATVQRGTRMLKVLSARQLAGYLHGRLPSGFCYRECDLPAPADLGLLIGDDSAHHGPVFGLRWRATDPADFEIPFADAYPGLVAMPPHDRLGPGVLGTGFAPSSHHLIPEFVTAGLADLPMPANAALVAFAPDGAEIPLYLYLPEQRAWTKMFGPQWRHLLAGVPEVPPEQEYVQIGEASPFSRLVGRYRGELYDAVADPPDEFRILARARAARYPVETLARSTAMGVFKGARCSVVRAEGDWLRVRLAQPDPEAVAACRAQCVERGAYETWAPAAEVRDRHEVEVEYPFTPG